jgi:uncharacterized protein
MKREAGRNSGAFGRALQLLLMALLLLFVSSAGWAAPQTELTIATAKGPVRFTVEFVDTAEGRAKGLMFRHELAPDHGMLFDFKESQPVAFWMRNTLIPLDMLFIDADGRIVRIHERAKPHDDTPIPSVFPVRAVLEIAGGEASRQGIAVDDEVSYPIFGR